MSTDPRAGGDVHPKVVTIVLVRDPSAIGEGLDALEGQVYETTDTFLLGGGSEIREAAERRGLTWARSLNELRDKIPADTTYVWFVSAEVRARPDALGALVTEAQRTDASVAGSKALRADDPELLVSVGLATDVFAVPYLGIDHDERDQAQFDVIRDVAAASAESLLVRRDLLQGLRGPDPELAPEAAGIDFCFRARLRGARIVVVPSSEVLVPVAPGRATTPWIEEAGRIRAMVKSYSLVTLLWALPLAFLIGLVEALVAPLLGRWTLFRWGRAWLWNVLRLPSTIAARLAARAGRVAGDEELFRYQIRGSAKLRSLGVEASELIQERMLRGRVGGLSRWLAASQAAVRSAGFVWAAATAVLVLGATRSIWTGRLPAVGYSLPPAGDAGEVLSSYAGGWNPAGLGTLWPLRPAVGAVAGLQQVLLDRPALTATVITMLALLAGAFGVARLLRSFGVSPAAAYLGGVAYFAGPAAAAIADTTHWTALVALGPLPWVVRLALRQWPASTLGRVARAAALVLLSGLVAIFLPAAVVLAPAALALWALVGTGARWMAVVRGSVAAVAALPLLFPWLGVIEASAYLREGAAAFWEPHVVVAALLALAALAAIIVGDRLLSTIVAWGALLTAAGTGAARLGDFGAGADVELAGLLGVALGSSIVVGAAVETFSRLDIPGWRRSVSAIGAAAALGFTLVAVPFILPGRAGLPQDRYRDLLEFTTADGVDGSRVLLLGAAESLPGDSRSLDGTAYRVVSVPTPSSWEARLGVERQADRALEAALRSIVSGESARAGQVLAEFGIEWVIFLDETVFDPSFVGKLDLLPLPGLNEMAFINEVPASRAVTTGNDSWTWDGPGYSGNPAPGQSVIVAEAADQRWGPGEWAQHGWANEVGAGSGVATFSGRPGMRNEAAGAFGYFVLLLVVAAVGSGRRGR
jgi:hypothetical protein